MINMSASIRTNNIFAAEDYKKVFKAFSFIDYTGYDFETLRSALINYIQVYHPETFNDYIQSSEFIAVVELIAYLGTSLAFRTDLNSRENFLQTAERKESIVRLAQMVNYVPQRNIAASGLFKIASVQTNQPLVDANGININDVSIFWNDPNNPDWFDQFVQICNAAFNTLNPFGRPSKSGTVGNIPTDLYELNSVTHLNITYPTTVTINNQQYPVDICNPDFITGQTIFERKPDPNNAFNFIYRNDSLGVGSANSGFFLYFKQGSLFNIDTNFEFPVPNRLFPIDIQNINQTDVYVQQTDQAGNVTTQWQPVPALAGENIIYNSIQFSQRNIFDVISNANDTITVRFADGNFGNVPTGLFRFWVRTSANDSLVIRPENAQGLQINIPYVGFDNQQYNLTISFNLEQTIGNAAPSESNDQIKLRAPEVFSTQSRMVNGSDYNVLPLVYGNQISKIQSINRTYSGQSRYIDLVDPTGFHRDLIIFGQDGALYKDIKNSLNSVIKNSSNSGNIENIVLTAIQSMLEDDNLLTFFNDDYISQFEETIRVNPTISVPAGYSILDMTNPATAPLFWRTSPSRLKNSTGYFTVDKTANSPAVVLVSTYTPANITTGSYQPYGMIRPGATVDFANSTLVSSVWTPDFTTLNTAPVDSVIQSGLPVVINSINPYLNIGPVELGINEQNYYQVTKIRPNFRTTLNDSEKAVITSAIQNGVSFWLYYDLLNDIWGTSTNTNPSFTDQSSQPFIYPGPHYDSGVPQIYSDWGANSSSGLLYVQITSNIQDNTTTFNFTSRGRVYVFESRKDVKFFWEPNQIVIDNASGLALQDTIEVMPFVNTNSNVDNNDPTSTSAPPNQRYLSAGINFNISGIFTQDDGFQDTSKIQVSPVDSNGDGVPDDPNSFSKIITSTDRIVFETYTDALSGYKSTRPWISNWVTSFESISTMLYVYFPVSPLDNTKLYSAPYISTILESNIYSPSSNAVFLNEVDLVFLNNTAQLDFNTVSLTRTITNQITAFFNGPTSASVAAYPWLAGTQFISNKIDIINNYFVNKSFLVNPMSALPGYGTYKTVNFASTLDLANYPSGSIIISNIDNNHYDKNGKTFTQNTSVNITDQLPFYFKWSHYSPIDQRVDPSPSNIIDMIVITDSYYQDILIWKNSNGTLDTLPKKPTTEELRLQFQNLDQYKMVSDSMVWNSGDFLILFGPQAEPELQANFMVVKSPNTNVSDNEIKTKVIQSIDTYFDIRNWDFGETFFYTELAAFIHQQLSTIISSVVISPANTSSQFGNLFEIVPNATQVFLSTATVNSVQIVSNLTVSSLKG